jgi:uncharacterized membrane protein YhaH (DUF805 family)
MESVYASYSFANLILFCVALGVAISIPKTRGKRWLIAFLVTSCFVELYFLVGNLFTVFIKINHESFDKIYYGVRPFIFVITLISYAFLALFFLALKLPEDTQQGIRKLLFSFRGRACRRDFWVISLILFAINIFTYFLILQMITTLNSSSNFIEPDRYGFVPAVSLVVMLLWAPITIWISLAITVKRWHDRGKSGWMILVGLIPILGGIWTFIETGCLKGTEGPNVYDPEPADPQVTNTADGFNNPDV